VDTLALYERCGFRLARVVVGAVDDARKLKPAIPVIGAHGMPMHTSWSSNALWCEGSFGPPRVVAA
jgi:hypothetical protein